MSSFVSYPNAILQMKKIAHRWQSRDLYPGLLALDSEFLLTVNIILTEVHIYNSMIKSYNLDGIKNPSWFIPILLPVHLKTGKCAPNLKVL